MSLQRKTGRQETVQADAHGNAPGQGEQTSGRSTSGIESPRTGLEAEGGEAKPKSRSPAGKKARDGKVDGLAAKPEGAPTAKAKTSATRVNAAAFVAARQKMAPAPKQVASTNANDDVVKSTADTTEKAKRAGAEAPATVQPAAPPVAEAAPEVARPSAPMPPRVAKPAAVKGQTFKTGEYIVYPAHGVGQITAVEQQEVAGYKLELFVIAFVKDKMILKVPLPKIASVGMRKLAEPHVVKRGLDTLTGRARVKRTMWSRRAQEYEAKINSGDLVAIAEVVRDLYRSDAQPEQSYSERQLYEAALDRLARELASVQKLTDSEALKLIDDQLQKGPRRTKAEDTDIDDEAEETGGGIGEAA